MEPTDIEEQQQLSSVAYRVDACLQLFETCFYKAASIGPQELSLVDDQVAKFSVWKNSAGIHSTGRGSLDYRLRDAPKARDIVLGLLEGLSYRLEYCINILDSIQTIAAGNGAPSADTELQDALREIGNEIDLFHNFANTIRRASRQAQNQKAIRLFGIRDDNDNDLEPFLHQLFANYIRDRFPGISDPIRKRVADTMLIRRKRILYRRSRYGENSSQKPRVDAFEIRRPNRVMGNQSPKSLVRKPRRSDAQESVQDETVNSHISGESMAPTATTLKSHDFQKALAPSVISISKTVPLNNQTELPFPPSPCDVINRQYEKLKKSVTKEMKSVLDAEKKEKLQQLGHITCQYCFLALPAQAAADETYWRQHVKEDLDPYVCLFESCPSGEQLYSHSQEWLDHMEDHCLQWSCNAKSHGKLFMRTKKDYIDHMKTIHPGKLTDAQIGVLADRNVKSLSPMFTSCPLCGVTEDENMENHIIDHMRLLALRSLPPCGENARELDDSFSQASVSIVITNPRARSTIIDDCQEMPPSTVLTVDSENGLFQEQVPSQLFRSFWRESQTPGKYGGRSDDHLGGRDAKQSPEAQNNSEKEFPHVLDYQNTLVDRTRATMIGAYEPTAEFFDESLFSGISTEHKRAYEWGFLPGIIDISENPNQDPILRNIQIHMTRPAEEKEIVSGTLHTDPTSTLHEVIKSLPNTPDTAGSATSNADLSTKTAKEPQEDEILDPDHASQISESGHADIGRLDSLDGPDISTRTLEGKWINYQFSRAHSLLEGLRNQQQIRIAIMDTGCHRDIPHFEKHPEDYERVVWKDFVISNEKGPEHMVDEDMDRTTNSLGHGSLIASLLLNLAPTAIIYVCRVFRTRQSASHEVSKRQISSALDWAQTHVDVSIVGFKATEMSRSQNASKTTISWEERAGVGRVYFRNDRYRQRMGDSIAVIGADSNGAETSCPGRPITEYSLEKTFCTLGKDIPCDWMGNKISGYEVAAAILAAVAAIFLEYDSSDNACEAAGNHNLPALITEASDSEIIRSLFCFLGDEVRQNQWHIEPERLFMGLANDIKIFYHSIRNEAIKRTDPLPPPPGLRKSEFRGLRLTASKKRTYQR